MATAVARLTNAPEPIRAARPEVSRPLEDVLARSLARDPEYRYQSAQALKDALAPGLDMAPTGPLAPPVPPRRAAPPPDGPSPTQVAPSPPRPAPPQPAPPARPARRWPWLVLILLLLVAGGITALVLSNLSGDDSGGGTGPQASSGGVLPIVEASAFDPFVDGEEHSSEAPRAIDSDPGTAWQTDGYSNRNFGNAKPGVGLWVQLDAPHDITSVTVTALEGGWSGEIYVADQPGNTLDAWGAPRASGDNVSATHPFALNARGQYVLVWCTQLPPSNKLQIGDVKVEGR